MAFLVQLLLPTADNTGQPFDAEVFAETRIELLEQFGGITAYLRAPARGLWKSDDQRVDRDDIVIFEVMTDALDREWWQAYRERLRRRFQQDELVVRALALERL